MLLRRKNTPSADVPKEGEPIIVIEGLEKSFGEKDVLKGLNLTVRRGENLVVLGKSGTGKSVLIKCIVRLIEPDAGKLMVLGKDMLALKRQELEKTREKIGFLFQSAALYGSMTVAENLAFPLERLRREMSDQEIDEAIDEALTDVGLLEAKHKMPSELSGGMRKRVGLARTLILKPDIMLYDEPTTGLDPVTSHEISELILKMQKTHGITSIIITHDMPCASLTANRVVILKDGTYIAEGPFNELAASEDPFIRSFFDAARIESVQNT